MKLDLIYPKKRERTHQKTEDAFFFGKSRCDFSDKIHLVFRVVCAGNENVLQRSLSINAKAASNRFDSLMSERALGINVSGLVGGIGLLAACNRTISSPAQNS